MERGTQPPLGAFLAASLSSGSTIAAAAVPRRAHLLQDVDGRRAHGITADLVAWEVLLVQQGHLQGPEGGAADGSPRGDSLPWRRRQQQYPRSVAARVSVLLHYTAHLGAALGQVPGADTARRTCGEVPGSAFEAVTGDGGGSGGCANAPAHGDSIYSALGI